MGKEPSFDNVHESRHRQNNTSLQDHECNFAFNDGRVDWRQNYKESDYSLPSMISSQRESEQAIERVKKLRLQKNTQRNSRRIYPERHPSPCSEKRQKITPSQGQNGIDLYQQPIPEEETLQFTQLTRPSRKVLYHGIAKGEQNRRAVIGSKILLFLVRPLQLEYSGFALASEVTIQHAQVMLNHLGLSSNKVDVQSIPGSIKEFQVLIAAQYAHLIPQVDCSVLVLDPNKTKKHYGIAIPPFLFEQIDNKTTTPSSLQFLPAQQREEEEEEENDHLPHYSLVRNSKHYSEKDRLISIVLDNNFNLLPLLGQFTKRKRLPFTFPNKGVFRKRKAIEEINVEIGLSYTCANVIINWEQHFRLNKEDTLQCFKSDIINFLDCLQQGKEDSEHIIRSCHLWTCSVCFAESKICHDETDQCRFKKWYNMKHPINTSNLKQAFGKHSAIPASRTQTRHTTRVAR